MRKALSVKAIEAFKPKVKRYEVHDILCPGFSLRVFPTGRKVFSVKYRYGLTQRRLPRPATRRLKRCGWLMRVSIQPRAVASSA